MKINDKLTTINTDIWDTKRINENRFEIIDNPINSEQKCLKVSLQSNDLFEIGSDGNRTERSELTEIDNVRTGYNQKVCYKFSVYFPEDYVISDNRFVFAQWKQENVKSEESPFVSLKYIDGIVRYQLVHMKKKMNYKKEFDLRGKWNDFMLIYLLKEDNTGLVQGFINGDLIVNYNGDLGTETTGDDIYFKFGLYRDHVDYPQYLLFSDFTKEVL